MYSRVFQSNLDLLYFCWFVATEASQCISSCIKMQNSVSFSFSWMHLWFSPSDVPGKCCDHLINYHWQLGILRDIQLSYNLSICPSICPSNDPSINSTFNPCTICYLSSVTCHLLPTIYRLPSTIYCLPSTVHHPPSNFNHLPFTSRHPPSTILDSPSSNPLSKKKNRRKKWEDRR